MSALPNHPSLRHLKKTAKHILKACRSGDPEALSTLRNHPVFSHADDLKTKATDASLQQVQHALAIEYGYPNWDKLLEDVRVQFAIFAPSYGRDVLADLCHTLAPGQNAVRVFDHIEDALKSEGEVLVTSLLGQDTFDLHPDQINTLRGMKVFGVGYGAGKLFRQIGLDLNDGMFMHYARSVYTEILPDSAEAQPLSVNRVPPGPMKGHADNIPHHCGIFLHPKGFMAGQLQALARVATDLRYAALARQGNYILAGTQAEMQEWTPEYRAYLGGLLRELVKAGPAKVQKISYPQSELGAYSFELAPVHSLEERPEQRYDFRFRKPGVLNAKLHQEGSKELALIIGSTTSEGYLVRKNVKTDGNHLEASFDISQEHIDELGDGSWFVGVTNFDPDHRATCDVEISYL